METSSQILGICSKFNRNKVNEFEQVNAVKDFIIPILNISNTSIFDKSQHCRKLTSIEQFSLFCAFHYLKYKSYQAILAHQNLKEWLPLLWAVRSRLICGNLKLVNIMIDNARLDRDHGLYYSEGYYSLIKSVDSFDPWLGTKPSTYICFSITRAFNKLKRMHNQTVEIDDIDQVCNNKYTDNGTSTLVADEMRYLLANNPNKLLSERELYILKIRYGIFCEKRKLKEIEQLVGLCSERIRQIEKDAKTKLRTYLQKRSELHLR